MMYPHSIYIVNAKQGLRGALEYFVTELNGVHYQDSQAIRLSSTEHLTDNKGYVQIPHSVGGYVNPYEWQDGDNTSNWTLQEGDLIIKSSFGLNRDEPHKTKGARTIETIENNDYSISIGNHYKVTLK